MTTVYPICQQCRADTGDRVCSTCNKNVCLDCTVTRGNGFVCLQCTELSESTVIPCSTTTPQRLLETFVAEARAAGYDYEGLVYDEMMFAQIRGATPDQAALIRASNKFTAGLMRLAGLDEPAPLEADPLLGPIPWEGA